MNTRVTAMDDLYRLVRRTFGKRISGVYRDGDEQLGGTLYAAFPVRLTLEPPHGVFGAAVLLGEQSGAFAPFGEPFAFDSAEEAIVESLARIDEYCRLRLPDKYLERFDAAHGTGPLSA